MKKITLIFITLLAFNLSNAQNTCATAQVITAGTYPVLAVNGTEVPAPICAANGAGATAGEWYVYTPTVSGTATVSTNIAANDVAADDTRLHIYTGACGTLTCVGGNDDFDYDGGNYLSEATFNILNGTSYYIAFDNRWNAGGFDFELTESPATCLVPNGYTANSLTTTELDLSWNDDNTGTPTWEIEYDLAGFTQGAGTMITGITTTDYVFSSLTADTDYEFYIRTNCGLADGYSEWDGPIGFTTAYDCASYGLPYNEDWSNNNAYNSCYTIEDSNTDGLSWLYNNVNDVDGDLIDDPFANIFPQAAGVAKDDWLFTPAISGTQNTEYTVTIRYNAVDFNGTANETFDLAITDTPSSTAPTQSTIGSYSNITQAGLFGDTGGNDLKTQAYTSTETFTASADGDFHVAIHATTPAADSDVFFVFSIEVTPSLSVAEFDANSFNHFYDKDTDVLTLESPDLAFNNIQLFNILGQEVINKGLSQTTEAINVSSLKDGIYLAKVTIEGKTKTIKFLKH